MMSKNYETLSTIPLNADSSYLPPSNLPEVVHLEDPALAAMFECKVNQIFAISPNALITHALIEMEVSDAHLLLVVDEQDKIVGIVSTEHILGEETIKLIQKKNST